MVYPFPRPFPGPSILKSFTVLSLFSSGEQGAWYDPSDFSTMFTDAAGTTPVTAVEQPVGLLLDKSKGLALGAELVTNGNPFVAGSWTANNECSIVGGALTCTTVAGANAQAYQSIASYSTAKVYQIDVNITSLTGTLTIIAATSTYAVSFTTPGIKTLTLKPTATDYPYITARFLTGASGSIASISIKEVSGNHASQSTAASRPVLSARVNLLTYSEQFDNAAWTKYNGATVSPNQIAAPDGTNTADVLIEGNGTAVMGFYGLISASAVQYTHSICFKKKERRYVVLAGALTAGDYRFATFDLDTGAVTNSGGASGSVVVPQPVSLGNGWYRCSIIYTATASSSWAFQVQLSDSASAGYNYSYTGNGTSGIYVWGADLRVTNVGVNLPAYQRVGAAVSGTTNPPVTGVPDYDTSGFPLALKFDGVDDSLATGTIDFSATDKMSVFAGVRKLSDAATGMILELSSSLNGNPGTFYFLGPYSNGQTNYNFSSKGTLFAEATGAGFVAPITSVLTGTGDIIGDLVRLRSNGTQVASSVADQGAGNFGNYPLYIGRRGGSTLPYNGNLYSLIVRGALSTDAQIASTETYVNNLTKAY